jgi:hypothetical protein
VAYLGECALSALPHCLGIDTDSPHQVPRKFAVDYEFRHFLVAAGYPVRSGNRIPIEVRQSVQGIEEVRGSARGVDVAEGPSLIGRFGPSDGFTKISHEMHNRFLTVAEREIGMILLTDDVQHNGSWTEIKWYVLPNHRLGMASDRKTQSIVLDLSVANDPSARALSHYRVRPQESVCDNRREIVDVNDVIDFRVSWDGHHTGLEA